MTIIYPFQEMVVLWISRNQIKLQFLVRIESGEKWIENMEIPAEKISKKS